MTNTIKAIIYQENKETKAFLAPVIYQVSSTFPSSDFKKNNINKDWVIQAKIAVVDENDKTVFWFKINLSKKTIFSLNKSLNKNDELNLFEISRPSIGAVSVDKAELFANCIQNAVYLAKYLNS